MRREIVEDFFSHWLEVRVGPRGFEGDIRVVLRGWEWEEMRDVLAYYTIFVLGNGDYELDATFLKLIRRHIARFDAPYDTEDVWEQMNRDFPFFVGHLDDVVPEEPWRDEVITAIWANRAVIPASVGVLDVVRFLAREQKVQDLAASYLEYWLDGYVDAVGSVGWLGGVAFCLVAKPERAGEIIRSIGDRGIDVSGSLPFGEAFHVLEARDIPKKDWVDFLSCGISSLEDRAKEVVSPQWVPVDGWVRLLTYERTETWAMGRAPTLPSELMAKVMARGSARVRQWAFRGVGKRSNGEGTGLGRG